MKSILVILPVLMSSLLYANSLKGVVTYKEKEAKGILFIFAKKFDGSMPMPLAVKRISNPKFPLKFELSSQDAMIKSIPFKGPFKVIARLTKSGNAMDKTGPQGQTSKSLALGAQEIEILLN